MMKHMITRLHYIMERDVALFGIMWAASFAAAIGIVAAVD